MTEHRQHISEGSGVVDKPFIALCGGDCGWVGHVQATRALAENEHDDHVITAQEAEQ